MAVTLAQLEQLYLAYFGRPADANGVAFYTSNPNATVASVEAAFASSAESQALYGSTPGTAFVNAIYQNLFNRQADPAGLLYWTTQIANGVVSPAAAALVILQAATGTDATTIQNKLAVSTAFTLALNTTPAILAYSGAAAAAEARALLSNVTFDPASVTNAVNQIPGLISVMEGVPSGQTILLTTGLDQVVINSPWTTDTVDGVVNAGPLSTFNSYDTIQGNGKTIVNMAAQAPGSAAAPFSKISNVASINVGSAVAGAVTFDASAWTSVGSINLNTGADGERLNLTSVQPGTALNISTVKGSIFAKYSNSINVFMSQGHGDTINYDAYGNVAATTGVGNRTVFNEYARANKVNVVVGNVAFAGNNALSGTASAFNNNFTGVNLAVGNVSMSGYGHENLYVQDVYNQWWNAAAPAANVMVGNVSMNSNGNIDARIYNEGYNAAGSLAVGNITTQVGASTTNSVRVYLKTTHSGSTAATTTDGNLSIGNVSMTGGALSKVHLDAQVNNYNYSTGGIAAIGNVAMGDLTLNIGAGGHGTADLRVTANGNGGASIGNVAIGNTTVTVGAKSTGGRHTDQFYANGGTKAGTIGTVTIGSTSVNAGKSATFQAYNDVTALAGAGKTSSIGNVSVGNMTAVAATKGYVYEENYIRSNGTIGNITLGDQTVSAGVNARASISNTAYAQNAKSGNIGTVTMGNVNLTAATSGQAWGELYLRGLNIGNVTVGNISVADTNTGATPARNPYAEYGVYVQSQYTKGSVANVSAGNVSISAAGTKAHAGVSVSTYGFTSAYSTVGNITVGNVSMNATGKSATNYFYADEWHGSSTKGNVTVGNISMAASGTNAHGFAGVYENHATAMGTVSVGNVSLSASGPGAKEQLKVYTAGAPNNAGLVSVGNVGISVNDVKTTGTASVNLTAQNVAGSVTVGNIALQGSGKPGTVSANVNVWATATAGTATVGNVTVVGDGASDSNYFSNLWNWLHMTGKNLVIGNIDYSGYTAASTINLTGVTGAASINVNNGKADIVWDTTGTNAITGSLKAGDSFYFQAGNTGVTQATMDQIINWHSVGTGIAQDTIFLGGAGGSTTVTEVYGTVTPAVYTSFSQYLGVVNNTVTGVFAGDSATATTWYAGYVQGYGVVLAVDTAGTHHATYLIGLAGTTTTDLGNIVANTTALVTGHA